MYQAHCILTKLCSFKSLDRDMVFVVEGKLAGSDKGARERLNKGIICRVSWADFWMRTGLSVEQNDFAAHSEDIEWLRETGYT